MGAHYGGTGAISSGFRHRRRTRVSRLPRIRLSSFAKSAARSGLLCGLVCDDLLELRSFDAAGELPLRLHMRDAHEKDHISGRFAGRRRSVRRKRKRRHHDFVDRNRKRPAHRGASSLCYPSPGIGMNLIGDGELANLNRGRRNMSFRRGGRQPAAAGTGGFEATSGTGGGSGWGFDVKPISGDGGSGCDGGAGAASSLKCDALATARQHLLPAKVCRRRERIRPLAAR